MEENDYFSHETAIVDSGARVGEGTKIWHFVHVSPGTNIGRNCVLGQNVYVGPGVIIGDGCLIQNQVNVYEGVTLEDRVFCGPSMTFTNVYTPRAGVSRKNEFGKTLVKEGATIGAGAVIVCGKPGETRTIGKYSLIGSGSVVQRDVDDYAVMIGNPIKQIGWACECGEVVSKELEGTIEKCQCVKCNKNYSLSRGKFIKNEN